ncbi:OmpA family protein [Enterovibrio nigricans]|uniref:Outer membrane protein OmpA n=1 Tax=Enterovibrio nigricans DSM 22720 TaxID=1121868 RepID=A0A1T4URL2_9GAMM|nr:OmpA family protein [Enterovibrio nigricans]PKF50666.1 OmpA family protein [Enterovibrio nigricans]SKA55071.1 Outer membrane protein OmpA [Enterovibrio nigricans DSM 22720]
MTNAVWLSRVKFKKAVVLPIAASVLFVAGCSLAVDPPPVAQQMADLKDTDGDGVINQRDACSGTPPGADINNDGCAEVLALNARDNLHILFANNSARIPASFLREVDQLARFMKSFPQTHVELKGYASPIGSIDANQALSERRANAVKQALVRKGVTPDRIMIVGFGENEPVAANSEHQTEILSRRVTASVAASDENVVMKWTIYSTAAK